jgi:hypothetical protein
MARFTIIFLGRRACFIACAANSICDCIGCNLRAVRGTINWMLTDFVGSTGNSGEACWGNRLKNVADYVASTTNVW